MKIPSTLFFLFISSMAFSQSASSLRIKSFEQVKEKNEQLNAITFQNIGPTVMSGRVTDVEVNPDNPHEFYIAYASGGVWYTLNNGLSMTPIFDQEATLTIGDISVNWKLHTIWVGTGEVNSSRSSYAGVGVYVSTDTGKTWHHKGLEETHHIGKIIQHPNNPNIVWVAALGHLYTYNTERGIFKTEDGGKSWKKTLYINDSTGCVDLILDEKNPDILYASSWTRARKAWHFNGSGKESKIYKSTDAGVSWHCISQQNGFIEGDGVGRIGLAICKEKNNVLYALVDNNFHQEEEINKNKNKKDMNARDIEKMNKEHFLSLDTKIIKTYLEQNGYPEKYTAQQVKEDIQKNIYTVAQLAQWKLADADANLFNTPIHGAQLYRSDNAGKTWHKTHSKAIDGMYFTYGYYFGTIQVSATNADKVCIAGYPLLMSQDGGATFKSIDGENCHPDYHRIWINPKNDKHIIACNDGGLNISYDDGTIWYKANNPAVGQFYAIAVDNAKEYHIYGGLQDNGTWVGTKNALSQKSWHENGSDGYKEIGGGDGMQVQIDTRSNEQVFFGYQFGNYFSKNLITKKEYTIKPIHNIGEKPYRFNWQTPILLSKHSQEIFYMGSNCFHRSMEQGKKIETLSGDLASTTFQGNVPYGTLTSISESPLKFGLIYVGSDNGQIHCSKDVGYTWQKISQTLPPALWVSRIVASRHAASRVYTSLNGYRNDDFTPYLFVSNDFGKTWNAIGLSLPFEPINVICEDPKDERILYVGTDNGLYVSFDLGKTFLPWQGNLPRVAIHDIAIQERENEIVLGTHGRSLYVASLDKIQAYNNIKHEDVKIVDIDPVFYSESWGTQWAVYADVVEPKREIYFYTKEKGEHRISIKNNKGKVLWQKTIDAHVGYNCVVYDMKTTANTKDKSSGYISIGDYEVELTTTSGKSTKNVLHIKERK
ncbi:MAG: hypothetical protein R2831_01180 [Chitinophagaceae bacterium]